MATDPPFNKGKDFHATPESFAEGASFHDRWRWDDIHNDWIDFMKDEQPELWNVIQMANEAYGDDMGAFLCFLGVRLLEMWRVLKSTGSLYLHCDPTASHYIKMLLDAIFGKENFRNEIIWCYNSSENSKTSFQKKHDVIFYYVKSDNFLFNGNAVGVKRSSTARYYTDENGRKYTKKYGKIYYVKNTKKIPSDWWADIPKLHHLAKERTGYPTQKPLALYERMILASSNEGDLVLDPFAGCATTCVAAEKLGRRWIGVDIWDKTHEVTVKRLMKECVLNIEGGERADIFNPKGDVILKMDAPKRTDNKDVTGPILPPIIVTPRAKKIPRAEVIKQLIIRQGMQIKCEGCDRILPHEDYIEVDHDKPRHAGGKDTIENYNLLCGPCNRRKSHKYTISGLRIENKKRGFMADQA